MSVDQFFDGLKRIHKNTVWMTRYILLQNTKNILGITRYIYMKNEEQGMLALLGGTYFSGESILYIHCTTTKQH